MEPNNVKKIIFWFILLQHTAWTFVNEQRKTAIIVDPSELNFFQRDDVYTGCRRANKQRQDWLCVATRFCLQRAVTLKAISWSYPWLTWIIRTALLSIRFSVKHQSTEQTADSCSKWHKGHLESNSLTVLIIITPIRVPHPESTCLCACVGECISLHAHVGVHMFVRVIRTHQASGSSPAAQTATWRQCQRWWFWREQKRRKYMKLRIKKKKKTDKLFSFL